MRLFEDFKRSPWPLQLLCCLAAAEYLSQGLQLTALSNGFDFSCFYDAASRIRAGQGASIYQEFFAYQPNDPGTLFYMYPPIVAVLYAPFAWLSFERALALFQVASHAALWAVVLLALRRAPAAALALVCATLLFFPVYYCVQIGQSDLWVLLLVMAAIALAKGRAAPAAGLLLALAACLKLFMLLGAVALILTRRWRLLAWAGAWFGALIGVGFLFVPMETQLAYWQRLAMPIGIEAFWDHHSVTGVLARLMTTTRYAVGLIDAPGAAVLLRAAICGPIVAAYALLILKRRHASLEAVLSFTVVTALLVAPISDTHHQVLLLLPFFQLLAKPRPAVPALAFYALFAMTVPPVAFKFLSPGRLAYFSAAPANLLLSLPFVGLAGLWAYWAALFRAGAEELAQPS